MLLFIPHEMKCKLHSIKVWLLQPRWPLQPACYPFLFLCEFYPQVVPPVMDNCWCPNPIPLNVTLSENRPFTSKIRSVTMGLWDDWCSENRGKFGHRDRHAVEGRWCRETQGENHQKVWICSESPESKRKAKLATNHEQLGRGQEEFPHGCERECGPPWVLFLDLHFPVL